MKDMEHHELTRRTVIEFYDLTMHITALITVCRRPCSSYTYVMGRGTSWLECGVDSALQLVKGSFC